MKITSFNRNFLFFLLLIYFSQGVIYPQGSVIAKIVLIFIFSLSSFYLIKLLLLKTYKPSFFWIWTVFVFLNTIGFIFTFNYGDSQVSGMIRSILITLILFYPFYHFAQKDELKAKHFRYFFLIMFPIIIAQFFIQESELVLEKDKSDVINNSAYILVYFLPFPFLFKRNRVFSSVCLLVLMFLIIESAKRSALITSSIILVVFVFYQIYLLERRQKIFGFLLIGLMAIGIGFYIYEVIINNEFLLNRLDSMLEGHTSGRDIILQNLTQTWLNSDFHNLLFGFGFASSMSITGGLVAHNDWVELLVNFGLFGLCIFMVLIFLATKYIFKTRWDTDKKVLMLVLILICILMGLVSRWYSSIYGYPITILLAFLIGSKGRYIN